MSRRKSVDLKKELVKNSLVRPNSGKKIELIDLNSESNSNMEISDDDCQILEIKDELNLDFIPLFKDDLDEKDDKKSDEESNIFTEYNEYENYDSDDSWFENNDETNEKNEFINYIPKYLLN